MKRIVALFNLVIVLFLLFGMNVQAEDKAKYCAGSDDCFEVDKDTLSKSDSGDVYYYKTTFGNLKDGQHAELMTGKDEVTSDKDKWWATLYACKKNDTVTGTITSWDGFFTSIFSGIGVFGAAISHLFNKGFNDEGAFVYTDSLESSLVSTEDKSFWSKLKSSEKITCGTYSVTGVSEENKVYVCSLLVGKENFVSDLAKNYNNKNSSDYHNPELLKQYKVYIEEMRTLCSQSSKFSDWNDGCLQSCIDLENRIYDYNKQFNIEDNRECGFSSRLIAWIMNILKWIKYIIPVAVIILGSLDFIKATASDKDDDVKKAQGNFVKRLIAAALIFLIPLLIEFILPKFGFDYNSCGLF